MIPTYKTFLEYCLDKNYSNEQAFVEIDDWVEEWHDDPWLNCELYEFLGITQEEYNFWVQDPKNLDSILDSRRQS